jgi:hypothetical protein
MFGGSVIPGTGEELLSDLTLDIIDYKWIASCRKIPLLKKAIKLIEQDGKHLNYFLEFYNLFFRIYM